MANVPALLTALRNTAEYDTTATGLQTDERSGRFTIYLADHAKSGRTLIPGR